MRAFAALAFGLLLSGCGPSAFPTVTAPPEAPAQTAAAPAPTPDGNPRAVTAALLEAARGTTAAPAAPIAAEPVTRGAGWHVVTRGETLSGIALATGLDARDLAVWNKIDDARNLQIGTELRLSAPGN